MTAATTRDTTREAFFGEDAIADADPASGAGVGTVAVAGTGAVSGAGAAPDAGAVPGSRRSAAGDASLTLLGIRHHGPGSARAVRAALEYRRPGVVLVEGPPEADAVVALAAEEDMRPPVALLGHAVGDPARASFWPFAEFSPEWVAIRWAAEHGVPVRFIDLPAANSLALRARREQQEAERRAEAEAGAAAEAEAAATDPAAKQQQEQQDRDRDRDQDREPEPERDTDVDAGDVRVDPLAVLARAAGYDDPERWWEDAVEHRGHEGEDPLAPFAAVEGAMAALRERYGDGGHADDVVREAHMRLRVREAVKEFERVAVVCGAWHVPALRERATVTADRALLRGLPKVRTEMTWVPWTHRRLARQGGYGAGIDSPGWYRHLFTAADRPVTRWLTTVAGLLRAEDHPVSSAHVIEAVRLAETLAAMRGRPLAGLTETTDAVRAVMCDGSDVPLALIHDRLVVGDDLGTVPDAAPAVPLARDLAREQRTLRMKPEAAERQLDLDLRNDNDAARSRLLHRLDLLGVPWGERGPDRQGTGTFREGWRLRWEPELSVRVAEAGVWGTTVEAAATAKAQDAAAGATRLDTVTDVAERCLLAGLSGALPGVMKVLADLAALDTDVSRLAGALPALVRSVRYGDVRGTDSAALREVAEGLATRICVGFPPACAGLDEDGARDMRGRLDAVHAAVALLAGPGEPLRDRWAAVLRSLVGRDATTPGLIRGRAARLLMDDALLEVAEAARLMGLALSPGTAPREAAGWMDGFLSGGGMLLVHDERLLSLVDAWLVSVPEEAFTDVLPLIRRTFAEFESGVRRTVGELVRRGPAGTPGGGAAGSAGEPGAPGFGPGLDPARADAVLPTLALLLGLPLPDGTGDLSDLYGTIPARESAAGDSTEHDASGTVHHTGRKGEAV